MRVKAITFIYPMPLSELQENILIVNLKAVKEESIKNMDKWCKRIGNLNQGMSMKLDVISKISMSAIKLEKESSTRYRFEYPDEDFIGLSFDFAGKRHELGHLTPKKVLVKFITNAVARDMGIKPGTVLWEEEDKEL